MRPGPWNSSQPARQSLRLRTYLLALVAVALLPVLGVSGMAVREALSAYQRSFEERLFDTSRALAAAVERDFGAHTRVLATLATSPLLDLGERGDFVGLQGFHERAVRAAQVLGSPVVLVGTDGRNLLHSGRPFGAALPMTGTPDAVRHVVEAGRPFVGNLGFGGVSQAPILPVIVPVERGGRVVAVLGSPVPPAWLSRLLAGQGLSAGRFAAAVDGNGIIVARSSRSDEAVGRRASDWFLQGAAGKDDGLLEGRSVTTREPVILAFKRLQAAPGWMVLVGEPRAVSATDIRRPLLAFIGGSGAVVLLAVGCATWLGRRVLRDVRRLEVQAEALAAEGDGGSLRAAPARPPPGDGAAAVSEFADLGRAMLRADRALREREERQMLLVREVDHRSKNALAVVQAVVRLTPGADPQSFQRAVQGRVDALARTHATLAKRGWRATDLGILLEAELTPYRSAVSLAGPPVAVTATAAQPLAMMVHELATNAVKHGALSVPVGTVSVSWWTRDGALHLRWREDGGPPMSGAPARRGFGTRMIEANIKGQLGGTARISWETSFACEISVPLPRILGEQVLPDAAT